MLAESAVNVYSVITSMEKVLQDTLFHPRQQVWNLSKFQDQPWLQEESFSFSPKPAEPVSTETNVFHLNRGQFGSRLGEVNVRGGPAVLLKSVSKSQSH